MRTFVLGGIGIANRTLLGKVNDPERDFSLLGFAIVLSYADIVGVNERYHTVSATEERWIGMEHTIARGRRVGVNDVFSSDAFEIEDELASVAGIRTAVILGAALWSLIIGSIVRFAL